MRLVLAVWSRGEAFAPTLAAAKAAHGDRPMDNGDTYCVSDGVALVPVSGPLMRHSSMFTEISGATSYGNIARDLASALADDEVRAIALCINSPGGEVTGCGELAGTIRAASAIKPVTAYIEGLGCSAAYWLACGAPRIVAAPTAMIGSIGVRCSLIDDSGAQEKLGAREIEIVSSGSPGKRGTPVNDAVIARAQTRVDDMAEIFVADVARNRGVSVATVLSDFGQGDAMIASKARAAGMVDEVDSLAGLLTRLRAPSAQEMRMTEKTPAAPPPLPAAATAASPDYQPLLSQVAAMTGETDPVKQQLALAQVKADLAAAQSDAREAWIAVARTRGVPPAAMMGWEHLPLSALKDAATKAAVSQAHQPGAPAAGSAPLDQQAAGDIALTEWDRVFFAQSGVTDEAQMLTAKRDALAGRASR